MNNDNNTEFNDLPIEQKHEVISASIKLMRTLTDVWGSDRGIQLWEKISEVLGPDIKGDIFFGMITGKYMPGVITVRSSSPQYFIEMIKAVRNATGYGLKEAKDFCDKVKNDGPQKLNCGDKSKANDLAKRLIEIGCEIIG